MLTPNALLDEVKKQNGLKSDRALAQFLDTEAPYMSRIRTGKLAVGPSIILSIHEKTGMPVAKIRELIAQK